LLANLPLLAEFGFLLEDFGGSSLLVREAPGDIGENLLESTLTELAQKLLTTGDANPDAQRDNLLHTVACKAAIKGGQKNGREELEVVAKAVVSGKVKFCPHGRPVAIELTKSQLEKQFKRA
ncbi:MAG: DNA mismatch repair protein MutL, partial [Oscillospiraceae bacterium]